MGLWRRFLWVLAGLKWKLVLNSIQALKKKSIQGNFLFIIQVRASVPHVRICLLLPLEIFSSLSMISAQWSSSLSVAYLLIQEIFKDIKKLLTSMKLKPSSDLGAYKMSWMIQLPLPRGIVEPVLTKLLSILLIVSSSVSSSGSDSMGRSLNLKINLNKNRLLSAFSINTAAKLSLNFTLA